jgi:MoaA/NifB/PqqE/SkfB family radical SAM enzyme
MGFLWNYARNLVSITALNQPRHPLLFSYYITHRCNLCCSYCSDGQGRPFKEDVVEELSTEDAKQLIKILRRSCDVLDFTGGEPILRDDLEELLSYARQIGFRTILNTKGINLPQRPDLMRLSDVLVLSVDSLRAERLAQIIRSSTDTAEKILCTLRWVVKNRHLYKTRVVMAAVAMPDNLDDVSETLDFAVKENLGFQLSPQIIGMMAHTQLRSNDRYKSLINKAIEAKASGAYVFGVFEYLHNIRDLGSGVCFPLLMPTIRPDGKVNLPCLERPEKRVDLRITGSYDRALAVTKIDYNPAECKNRCHTFCHRALSLLQQKPLSALRELKNWSMKL